ncbi:MAG: hypothetical protein J5871_00520 [Bacteroidales bacterium]|nr:hypothetical protein [Bacteroidales bacterium]
MERETSVPYQAPACRVKAVCRLSSFVCTSPRKPRPGSVEEIELEEWE